MKLEEAIENTKKRINTWENIAEIGKATLSKEEYENSQSICEEQKLLLEELERLQKENEELKSRNKILECCKYVDSHEIIKAKLEECERWQNKIREKIEEIKSRMNDDCLALHEFQREAKIDVLYDLLKEE